MAKKKSRRGITGIIALVLLLVVGIAVTAYLVSQQQDPRSRASGFREIRQNTPITDQNCAQVLTPARNTQTNVCRTFPSSCLPQGWAKDPSCTEQTNKQGQGSGACDIDNSGVTNLIDFSLLTQCVQGGPLCTQNIENNADLNSDGNIDAIDLNIYQRTCQTSQTGRQP